MPRTIKNVTYVNSRTPSPEEMLQIIQEQKRFIDNLKIENLRLQQHLATLENDRSSVLHVLGITQKNADEMIRNARQEAEEILEASRLKAAQNLEIVDGYVRQILETEDSLEGLLGFLDKFRQHLLVIDEVRMEDRFQDALPKSSAFTVQQQPL